ncbi:MAG: pyrroline-5-carboxylate reductase [Desulfobacterales bacterium]
MKRLCKKIGIIGAGNMGEAFAGAMIRSGLNDPSEIFISDIREKRLADLEQTYHIKTTQDNVGLFRECEILILAVKPQVMEQVLLDLTGQDGYSDLSEKKLIISIAAGIPIKKLETLLYETLDRHKSEKLPIIRVMPNTPALVLSGMSGMSGNRYASAEDIQTAGTILKAMGEVVEVKEEDLDAVTALSGSGPAYAFYLAEIMIDAGITLGFDPDTAVTLTMKTIEGALRLMQESKEPPEILRQKVTSPGGTTEAAFQILGANRVKEIFVEAIARAAARSRELSKP